MIGLFLSKTPLFILHTWLPKTHVEAPTSVSMLLAGILLKVGLFGVIKMVVIINQIRLVVSIVSLIGLTLASLITSLSSESKVITAISRITHINLLLYGLSVISICSRRGVLLIILRHGFISAIIFSLVGILYHLNGTRIIFYLTGLLTQTIYF